MQCFVKQEKRLNKLLDKAYHLWYILDMTKVPKIISVKHKNVGASFDSFLDDEGIREQVEDIAIKRVIAFQIQAEMEKKHLTKTELAKKMHTSRSSLNRLLDPEDEAITFKTLKKAADVLEKKLVIQLA